MIRTGETAPDFTVPKAGGARYDDIEQFTLSDTLGDGLVVLAFYPASFTNGCAQEMCAFRDSMPAFDELEAAVYGVSVDLPFAQNIWIQEQNLNFPMLSDWDHHIIHAYGVVRNDVYGHIETARRSIFIINAEGLIIYRWVHGGDSLDFENLVEKVRYTIAKAAE